MKKLILFVFIALNLSYGLCQNNPVIVGNARFTIITPELIRLEYALEDEFIDEPTLFAVKRDARYNKFEVTKNAEGWTQISTSRMKVEYKNDGFPFGRANFRIFYKNDGEEKNSTSKATIRIIQI